MGSLAHMVRPQERGSSRRFEPGGYCRASKPRLCLSETGSGGYPQRRGNKLQLEFRKPTRLALLRHQRGDKTACARQPEVQPTGMAWSNPTPNRVPLLLDLVLISESHKADSSSVGIAANMTCISSICELSRRIKHGRRFAPTSSF